jgi:hypothetical protein
MTLSELGNLGEFIGSILVLITLLYLVVQLRQTQRAMMAQTHQMRADGLKTTWQNLALSNEMIQVYSEMHSKGWRFTSNVEETKNILDDLGYGDRLRLLYWEAGLYIYGENSFYHYKQGFYDQEFYERNLIPYVRNRGKLWLALGLTESNGRVEWVNMIETETENESA